MPIYNDGEPVTSSNSYYGTVADGDIYFSNKLRPVSWTSATDAEKLLALKEATVILEMFAYRGIKTDSNQELEFPRGGDIEIPTDIEEAAYEIAFNILKGLDLDQEMRNANIKRRKYGRDIETEYFGNNSFISTGMLSVLAYQKIYPYLRDSDSYDMVRVS